jgi:lysophospholipase L1-like esterase
MNSPVHPAPGWSLLRLSAAFLGLLALGVAQPVVPPDHRIAIFGSSVASGFGDETGSEGYAGRLRALLAPRGWEVVNQSRGGDSTLTAAPRFAPVGEPQPGTKYLLPVNPAYVVIGLSLGNEGIKAQADPAGRDRIYAQFETGILGFIRRSRENRIVPVVANCYARADFTEAEYAYTRRMNLLIDSWDVPSINFLGAVDDGTGKWAKGFIHDSLHPNLSGHLEMATAIVPSLFAALEQGKPRPVRTPTTAFARIAGGTIPLAFSPAETMHPFSVAATARAQADGAVVSIAGARLSSTTYYLTTAGQGAPAGGTAVAVPLSVAQLGAINQLEAGLPDGTQTVADARAALVRASLVPEASSADLVRAAAAVAAADLALALARAGAFATVQASADPLNAGQVQAVVATAGRGSLPAFGRGGGVIEETRLTPAAAFTAAIGIRNGVWTYTAADGTAVTSTVRADGAWHDFVLSHYTARGETLFFVDGRLAGRTAERLQPGSFRLGASGGPVDLRDVLLYRSALNEDEVAAIHAGTLFQSSLEIYAPLAESRFTPGGPVENRAQSLSAFIAGEGLVPVAQ